MNRDWRLEIGDSATPIPQSPNETNLSSAPTPPALRTIQQAFARLATMAADPAVTDEQLQTEADAAIAQFPELLPDLAAAIARPMAMDMAEAAVEGAVEGVAP